MKYSGDSQKRSTSPLSPASAASSSASSQARFSAGVGSVRSRSVIRVGFVLISLACGVRFGFNPALLPGRNQACRSNGNFILAVNIMVKAEKKEVYGSRAAARANSRDNGADGNKLTESVQSLFDLAVESQ